MADNTKTYNAGKVSIEVDGKTMQGLAKDTFVRVEWDTQLWAKLVSADGFPSRSKSNDLSGKITITLNQTSESNAVLQEIQVEDYESDDNIVSVIIKDNSGETEIVIAEGWVVSQPSSEFGSEEKTRDWVFECGKIQMAEGGN